MANLRILLGLFLSGIGVTFSFSSFVFFFYGNYHAAVWALISGLLAAIDFHLLFLHYRRTLSSWHSVATVKDFEILAIFSMVIGLSAGAWYLFVFLYYSLPILPIPDSYPIAAVWAFMTVKWGIGLYVTARHLVTELQLNYPDLLPSPSYYRSRYYYERIAV